MDYKILVHTKCILLISQQLITGKNPWCTTCVLAAGAPHSSALQLWQWINWGLNCQYVAQSSCCALVQQ